MDLVQFPFCCPIPHWVRQVKLLASQVPGQEKGEAGVATTLRLIKAETGAGQSKVIIQETVQMGKGPGEAEQEIQSHKNKAEAVRQVVSSCFQSPLKAEREPTC